MKTALLGPAIPSIPINATSIGVADPGGLFGGDPVTLQEVLDLIGGGTLGAYLTTTLGGQGVVYAMGTLGATETIDLANGNKFWGTLDQDCTITTTGWVPLKDAQISVELIQDGTGGWIPTFSGVTWIGGTPTWDTTAGTVTHIVLLSRDGGTTIYGAVIAGSGSGIQLVTDSTVTGTYDIDCALGDWFDLTLTGNTTFTISNPPTVGEIFVIIRQGGSGSYTVTWPASVLWQDPATGLSGASAPTLYTSVNALNVIGLATLDSGTSWGGSDQSVGGGTSIAVLDEGSPLVSALGSLDFVGDVEATASGADVTVTVNATAGMVPYLIATGETFTVPLYKQALKAMAITVDGTLVVDGFLIEVN